jgi:hypothetical protein
MQQLSYLCLGGLCLTDAEARAVASMRRLRELELHNAPELSLTGLTHLTRLRELSKLTLKGVGCRRGIECALTTDPDVSHEARVPGGGVSTVGMHTLLVIRGNGGHFSDVSWGFDGC